jgi:hypothetical protein
MFLSEIYGMHVSALHFTVFLRKISRKLTGRKRKNGFLFLQVQFLSALYLSKADRKTFLIVGDCSPAFKPVKIQMPKCARMERRTRKGCAFFSVLKVHAQKHSAAKKNGRRHLERAVILCDASCASSYL